MSDVGCTTQAFFSMVLSTGFYFILRLLLPWKTLRCGLRANPAGRSLSRAGGHTDCGSDCAGFDLQVLAVCTGLSDLRSSPQALPLGQLWLVLFTCCLFWLLLTSLLFQLEPAVYWYQLHFRIRRRPALLVVLRDLGYFVALLAHSMVAEDGLRCWEMPWFYVHAACGFQCSPPRSLPLCWCRWAMSYPGNIWRRGLGGGRGQRFYFQALYLLIRTCSGPIGL